MKTFEQFRKELIIAIQCDIATKEEGDFELNTNATSVKVIQGLRSVEVGNITAPSAHECIWQGLEKPDWGFLKCQGYDFLIDALADVTEVGVYHKRIKLFSQAEEKDYFILTFAGQFFMRLEIKTNLF